MGPQRRLRFLDGRDGGRSLASPAGSRPQPNFALPAMRLKGVFQEMEENSAWTAPVNDLRARDFGTTPFAWSRPPRKTPDSRDARKLWGAPGRFLRNSPEPEASRRTMGRLVYSKGSIKDVGMCCMHEAAAPHDFE